MPLRLSDKWIWDFWLAQDGPDYHIFYLQAPRSLGDETLRHWNVSIGHAVSQDLQRWEILPDALRPTPAGKGAFDDYTTWTGSVIRHAGLWYLFYTGGTRAEEGLIQRIGLATSQDLVHWKKHEDNPLIVADPRWYEILNRELWHDQAWRDPYVVRHPATGDFHAFITARANEGPSKERGVIGHARSRDLIHWEVLPPVTKPGDFGHMEVPQWVAVGGRYYLLFCAPIWVQSLARREHSLFPPLHGTHYLISEEPLGPFHYRTDEFLVGDEIGSLYAGKLVRGPEGAWKFMAWRQFTAEGDFVGDITDPYPVTIGTDGALSVEAPLSGRGRSPDSTG